MSSHLVPAWTAYDCIGQIVRVDSRWIVCHVRADRRKHAWAQRRRLPDGSYDTRDYVVLNARDGHVVAWLPPTHEVLGEVDGLLLTQPDPDELAALRLPEMTVAWRRPFAPLGSAIDTGPWPPHTLVAADVMIVTVGARVLAMDTATGARRWEAALPEPVREGVGATSGLRIVGDAMIVGTYEHLVALDLRTGATHWLYDMHACLVPWVVNPVGIMFVCGTALRRLDLRTGLEYPRIATGRPSDTGVVAFSAGAFAILSLTGVTLYNATGAVRWQRRDLRAYDVSGRSDAVFVLTQGERILELDPATGATRWSWAVSTDENDCPTGRDWEFDLGATTDAAELIVSDNCHGIEVFTRVAGQPPTFRAQLFGRLRVRVDDARGVLGRPVPARGIAISVGDANTRTDRAGCWSIEVDAPGRYLVRADDAALATPRRPYVYPEMAPPVTADPTAPARVELSVDVSRIPPDDDGT